MSENANVLDFAEKVVRINSELTKESKKDKGIIQRLRRAWEYMVSMTLISFVTYILSVSVITIVISFEITLIDIVLIGIIAILAVALIYEVYRNKTGNNQSNVIDPPN